MDVACPSPMNDTDEQLGPCPRCGKRAGEFKDGGSGRFRYLVICGACAWSSGPARIKDAAVKLWNEARLQKAKD